MKKLKTALRLTALVKPLFFVMLLAIVLGVIGNLAAISITVVGTWMLFIDQGLLKSFAIALVFIAVLRGVLHYAEQDCNHYIAFRLLAIIRDKVFGALRALAPAKLEGKDKGNLISLLTSDIEQLEVFYAHTLSPIAIAFIVSLIMTLYIASFSLIAALIAAIAYITIGVLIPLIVGRKASSAATSFRSDLGALSSVVLESLRGLRETIQYEDGSSRLALIDKHTASLSSSESKVKKEGGKTAALNTCLIIFFSLAVLTIQAVLYIKGEVSFLAVIIPFVSLLSSFGPVVALANLGSGLQGTLSSGERVLAILDEKSKTPDIVDGKDITFNGCESKDLSFAYDKEMILKNFSLKVEKGSVVGIIGKSGSGKSTFLRLLMRFYDRNSGELNISNVDIKEINTHSLRENESLVTQESMLFHDSIKKNLLIAKSDATDEEIVNACKMASIHDFIVSLPHGYDTLVGELGDTLSGGEKQRLSLARAFLHNAPLILLDEPTSNLDSLNEAVILRSLKSVKGKTIILVSHRESTMRIASKIVKMASGRES